MVWGLLRAPVPEERSLKELFHLLQFPSLCLWDQEDHEGQTQHTQTCVHPESGWLSNTGSREREGGRERERERGGERERERVSEREQNL